MPDEFGAPVGDERKPWEQKPSELDMWYGRFKLYLALGPGRTIRQVYSRHAHNGDVRGLPVPHGWREAANRWNWRKRADAWDQQCSLELQMADFNVQLAAREKRVAWLEEWVEEVRDALRAADIANMDQEEARKHLALLARALERGVGSLRKEYEQELPAEAAEAITITADDMQAAARILEQQMAGRAPGAGEEMAGEAEVAHRSGAPHAGSTMPGRDMRNRQARAARRKVIVVFGEAAEDPFNFEGLRAGGLGYMRVREVQSNKFAQTLHRERGLGHGVELLHVELPSSANGIVFTNGSRDGTWLWARLRGVQVLLLARHADKEWAEWFAAAPCVVKVRAGIEVEAALRLGVHFWRAVGAGLEAEVALAEALAVCIAGTEKWVQVHGEVKEEH